MDPLALFNEFISKDVRIHTSERGTYTGCLLGFDMYVNMALRDARFVDGSGEESGAMGTCIVNGLTVTFVEASSQ